MRPAALIPAVQNLGGRLQLFWSDETALRARLTNVGHLLTGNLFGSVLGIMGFLVTARALGATDYGVLALTYSYTRVISLVVGSQSWQPLIKYGAELTGQEHHDDYRALLKFGLVIDVSTAVLAFLAAVAIAVLFGPLFGIRGDTLTDILIYSTTLLFQISGLPTAVLRLAGRFRLVAYASVVGGVVRLLLCLAGLMANWGLTYFVLAWTLSQIVGSLVLLVVAFVEMRRQGAHRLLSAPLRGVSQRFHGLWRFTIGSNIELTVRASAQELDTLVVGALTDPAGAGFYHIAKRLGRLMLQIGAQVQAVVYPDVARLWAQGAVDLFRRTVFQTEILLALFGGMAVAVTAVAIEPVLLWTVGAEFSSAASLAIVQMVAVAIGLSGSALRTALLAMGKQATVLKIVIWSTLVFHATALCLIPLIGAVGANVAHVVMGAIWLAGLMSAYRTALGEPGSLMVSSARQAAEAVPGDEDL